MASYLKNTTTLTALALTLALGSITAPAQADTTNPTSSFSLAAEDQQSTSSFSWGIKESFNSYVGGAYRLDGVTYANGIYTFNNTTAVQKDNAVELRGTGSIQFVSHCNPDKTPIEDCPLNLTFSNPRIVLNPGGESGVYFTVRTKNYMTKKWEGPHEVQVASIDASAATQTEKDGTVTWTNLATNLTVDGNQAFSNFYTVGEALAPLTLSYKGTPLDAQSKYSIAQSYNTTFEVGDVHKTFELQGKVISLSAGSWGSNPVTATVIDPSTMTALSSTTLTLDTSIPAVLNSDTQELVVYNKDSKSLDRYTLQGKNLTLAGSTPIALPAAHSVTALGYNPANQQYGLLALADDYSGAGNYITVNTQGTTITTLPKPASVSPTIQAAIADGATDIDASEYYGNTFNKNGRVIEALPDGSFLYAPGTNVSSAKLYDHLLRFAPDGSVSEVAEAPTPDRTRSLRGLKVAPNGYVYRWNTFWGRSAAMQILKLNGTGFEVIRATDAPLEGASSISGIFHDGTHTVIGDTTSGRLLWIDDNLNKVSEIRASHMAKTNQENPVFLTLSNGDIIFPTMVDNTTNYKEELWLTRLAKKQDKPTTVAISDHFTDVGPDHTFYSEITWLANTRITTGWLEADGTRTFRPSTAVNRDMMAAFLYRHAGSPAYEAPAESPFTDVPTDHVFYKEISWLASTGITTGWFEADGTRTFRPTTTTNRDMTAAFIFRFTGYQAY